MSEIEALKTMMAAHEARLTKLEAGGAKASTGGGNNVPEMEPMADAQLDKSWANKVVKKCPKTWKGEDYSGKPMADCPAPFLIAVARSFEYKAMKERETTKTKEETPEAYNSNGKPWFESSEFTAKLARAWAARATATPPAKSAPVYTGGSSGFGGDDFGDPQASDDIPFIRDATFLRGDRP